MKIDHCWIVYDHQKIGTLNQCLGLAEALDLNPILKPVKARYPWMLLPSNLWIMPLQGLTHKTVLTPPWPKLIIAGGRMSAAPSAAIRRQSRGQTKVIQILKPGLSIKRYDLVIVPQHDHLIGANVIKTLGPLHRVTHQKLQEARLQFESKIDIVSEKMVAVMIGGTNRHYQFDQADAEALVKHLVNLVQQQNYRLMVTVSRRTSTACRQYLKSHLQNLCAMYWDGASDPNPYFAYLGLADIILVTCDSISMIAEAASVGKPVYVYKLPGYSHKFSNFFQNMIRKHHIRFFNGNLDSYPQQPLDDMTIVCQKVRQHLKSS